MGFDDGGNGDRRMQDALDLCLSRIRAGESAAACLADYPDLATDLEPLLTAAATLASERVAPTAPPTGLAVGRARFLETATRTAAAESVGVAAALNLDDSVLTEPLDEALARVRSGTMTEAAVGAYPGLTTGLAPLMAMAGLAVTGRVSPPPPPRGLNPGRAHFLAVAAEMRAQRDAAPVTWSARLAALLGLGSLGSMQRVALGVLAMAVLFVATGAVTTSAAGALPGEPLYGVKRLGEQVRLSLAFSPAAKAGAQAAQSHARAREVAALVALGRTAEVDWQVRFRRLDASASLLYVVPLGDDDAAKELALAWADGSVALSEDGTALGRPLAVVLASLSAGSELVVRARTGSGAPVILSLRLVGPVTIVAAPAATAQQATSEPATATSGPPTATVAPPTNTPRSTIPPSPAPTTAMPPTAAPTAVQSDGSTEQYDILTGTLSKKLSAAAWQVGDTNQGGRLVSVDVTGLTDAERARANEGDEVKLEGKWLSDDGQSFRAVHLVRAKPPACQPADRKNAIIAHLNAGVSLTIEGQDGEFVWVPETQVTGMLHEGDRVDITYRTCSNGRQELLTIKPAAAAPDDILNGIVRNPDMSAHSFQLDDNGNLTTVHFAADVPISGAATLRDGQEVEVEGVTDPTDATVFIAHRIRVLHDAPIVAGPSAADASLTATALPPTPILPSPTPTAGASD